MQISKVSCKSTVLASLITLFAANAANAQSIVVALTGESVPFEYTDGSGQLVGFEVDLMKQAAQRMGNDVEFTTIPFNGLFSAVMSGRADIAVSSITVTPKRLESVDFTQPYFDSNLCLAVTSDSTIKKVEDLKGRTLGVVTGTTPEMWATQNQAKYGIADIRRHDNLSEPVLALGAGRIDALVQDCPMLEHYLKGKPQFKVTDTIITGEKFAAMGAKNSALLAKLNVEISQMKKEGKLAALYKKWFSKDATADSSIVVVLEPIR